MNFYIYQLRASDEEQPFYIGKSFVGSRRLNEHKCHSKKQNTLKANKIKNIIKRGAEVLEEILFEFETEQETLDKEVQLIKHYGRKDMGVGILCNHTDGGDGVVGLIHKPETRKVMSEAKKGNKLNVGRKRPDMVERFSKPVTVYDLEGNILKYFDSQRKAAKWTGITYKVINDCCRGKVRSCKNKETGKIYRFKDGRNTEKLDPIKFSQRKGLGKVQRFNMEGEFIDEYRNSLEARQKTGISDVSIRKCIHGEQKTAGKFIWRLKED